MNRDGSRGPPPPPPPPPMGIRGSLLLAERRVVNLPRRASCFGAVTAVMRDAVGNLYPV